MCKRWCCCDVGCEACRGSVPARDPYPPSPAVAKARDKEIREFAKEFVRLHGEALRLLGDS